MSIYLDASGLVPLFVREPASLDLIRLLQELPQTLVVSDLAAAEFASAIARRVRVNDMTILQAHDAFFRFDEWAFRETARAETTTQDVVQAGGFIRRLDMTLRVPDAIHIAIAQRVNAELLTLDRNMAVAAQALGTSVHAP